MNPIGIEIGRVQQEIDELALISESPPPVVTRVLFSEADLKARAHVKDRFRQAGLAVREDGAGNIFARWPGKIRPGTSDELVCLVDTLATCAALTGQPLPAEAGPDSFNLLPILLGQKRDKPVRDHLIEHRLDVCDADLVRRPVDDALQPEGRDAQSRTFLLEQRPVRHARDRKHVPRRSGPDEGLRKPRRRRAGASPSRCPATS